MITMLESRRLAESGQEVTFTYRGKTFRGYFALGGSPVWPEHGGWVWITDTGRPHGASVDLDLVTVLSPDLGALPRCWWEIEPPGVAS